LKHGAFRRKVDINLLIVSGRFSSNDQGHQVSNIL